MANANKPMGLSPHSYISGARYSGQVTEYVVLAGNTNAIAIGDPVVLAGSGDANGVPNVVLATAGAANTITGVCVGIGSGNTYGGGVGGVNQFTAPIVPATAATNTYILVADDPMILFEVQEGGAGTALATTDLGTNINLLSGANNGFVSGWQLDNNSKGTGVTLQCKLLRLMQRADNTFGPQAKWVVSINNHTFSSGTTGY